LNRKFKATPKDLPNTNSTFWQITTHATLTSNLSKKTVEQLLRQNIELAGSVINETGIGKLAEFFSVNIVPARGFTSLQVENFLKKLPTLDSTVTLNLSGKEFTRNELEQRIDQIKRPEGLS
jgi:hypothetical protein